MACALAGTSFPCASAWAQATDAQIAPASPDSDAPRLGEIVVTARRQRESAQNVPISLTSIAGGAFRDGQFTRIEDLNQFSPSLNIVMPTPGNASLSIRGVGANPGSLGLSGSVGTFIDGVYMGKPGMGGFDLIDLQQVDVLRGPQGTLFGKNTTAGALDIKTAQPSFRWSGLGQIATGNLGYQQYQGSITGPLSDSLAFRMTGYRSVRDGYIHDVVTGANLGSVDRWGLRGQILFRPNTDFSIRIIGDYNRESDSAITPVLLSYGAAATSYKAKLAAAGGTVSIDPDGGTVSAQGDPQMRSTNGGGSAEINWNIGNGMTLTSITAWRQWRYFTYGDGDLSSASVATVGTAYLRNDQTTQEIRLATAPSKPVSMVVGAYYYSSTAKNDFRTSYGADAASFFTGIPNALLPRYALVSQTVAALQARNNSAWDVWTTPHIQSYALFGQAVWHVTPRLSLTGGLRETYERETMAVWQPNPVSTITGAPVAALASNTYATTGVNTGNWATSWLGSADYALAAKVRAYALVSHGIKAGGINSTLPSALGPDSLIVKPETATNYELGIKSRFWRDRIQINVSLFDMEIEDYQALYQQLVPGGASSVSVITNVGKVRARGVELDSSFALARGLTLNLNGSYNDTAFRSYPDGPCPVEITGQVSCDLSGKPVPEAPRWIGNAAVTYRRDLGGGVTGVLSGNYAYQSSRYGYSDDSRLTLIGKTGLVNANLGIELADGRYQLSIWGKNLANVRQPTSFLSFGSLIPSNYAAFFNEPRTYGLRVRASF